MQAVAQAQNDERWRRLDKREAMEALAELADVLDPRDAALVQAVCRHGMSIAQCARAGQRDPRMLRRRFTRLMQRVRDPIFSFVWARYQHWPTLRRQVARHVFLAGRSQRDTAALLKTTLHRVRLETRSIRTMYEAAAELGLTQRHVRRHGISA